MSGKKFRTTLDVAMTILVVLLMGYAAYGEVFHEVAGVFFVALAVWHHCVNRTWIKTVFKGRYSLRRVYRTTIVLTMAFTILLQFLSGIVVSKHVFTFLPIEGLAESSREIHLLLAYWCFVLMGLHAGDLCRRFIGKLPDKRLGRFLWTLAGVGVFSYGVYVFIERKMLDYLLKRTAFAFFDYDETPVRVFLDYVAVFFVFGTIGAVVASLLQNRRGGKKLTDAV